MHELPKLTYAFDALEPHIDARTMEIHHGKHHQAYVDNLNKALANEPELAKLPVEDLLRGFATVPDAIKTAVDRLVDPVSKTLRAIEAEKAEKMSLQTVLNTTRTAYDPGPTIQVNVDVRPVHRAPSPSYNRY